jgi:hypothetical protein
MSRDLALELYGWSKVACSKCGTEFAVHPLSNAAAEDADLCPVCIVLETEEK